MVDSILDVFAGDAFTNISLTSFVNRTPPYMPGFLSGLPGLFTGEGIFTLDVAFDEIGGALRLLSTTARGGPPSQAAHTKGAVRPLRAKHLARETEINADEVFGTRLLGSLTAATAETLLAQRIEGATGLKAEMALTMEHFYMGAIDGVVYDGDNSTVLWDYFAWFGVVRPTAVAIAFSTEPATSSTIVYQAATTLRRTMTLALNGMALGAAKPVVLCGDTFFDKLVMSKEIAAARAAGAFSSPNALSIIAPDLVYASFTYGGVTWVNYRGSDDSVVSVPTGEGRAFMLGVPGLFQTYFAPADTFETISNVGLPYFMLQRPERQTSSRRVFEIQSNPLVAVLRPRSLIRLTAT
jgi:hypothetical protein